jgi:hypothetical protein
MVPGEGGSRDTDSLVGEDLTGRPKASGDEEGVAGRRGGASSDWTDDDFGGSEMDEFDEEGMPRRSDRDW